jgi:hypothetical protein
MEIKRPLGESVFEKKPILECTYAITSEYEKVC